MSNIQDALNTVGKDQSVKYLFRFFCNNLYLGQWELARASLQRLHGKKESTVLPISAVFKDVASYPFNRSLSSPGLKTPNLLAWLCLLEHKKLNSNLEQHEAELQIDNDLIEFRFLLIEACSNITDTQLKELYTYHRWVHSDASKTHTQSLALSPSLLKYLQTTLTWKPGLGHALINSIIPNQHASTGKNCRALQHVYTNSINNLLDQLKETDLDNDYKKQTAKRIIEILSVFDPGPDISYLPIRQLLTKILDVGKQYIYLSKDTILSVLIGHADNKLVEELCRLDYEAEINNAVLTYQSCAELTEEQRCLLHLSSLTVTNTRWKMFFLLTLKKQRHLLEAVMETGLSLIKYGMFEELQQLLSPYELQPLKPLLLLLGWTQCYSSAEARQLLQTLWHEKSLCDHPAITMGCNKLAYQIDLIQWCIEKTRPSAESISVDPHYQRAADLFKGLENHSVLYVLHKSTKLSALDQQEVLDLLHKVPLQGDKDEERKKTKSVHFADDELSPSPSLSSITSLDQRKDIAIYMGFCVLKSIMDAIMFCTENRDERLTRPVQCYSRRQINRLNSCSSNETDASGLSRHASHERLDSSINDADEDLAAEVDVVDVQDLYRKNVTEKLNCAKTYLALIQPLTFRIEIMENLFSLLFLTHEDIKETVVSEYNSDEVDDKSFRSSTGTGIDSPSPKRLDSMVFELPKVAVETVSSEYSSTAYDIPFEDVQKQRKTSGLNIEQVEQKLENIKENISKSRDKLFGKNLQVHREGHRSSFSGNISSVSNASNLSIDHFGFVVNEYLVRDILALLKDSLLDVTAAKFQLYGNRHDSKERLPTGHEVRDSRSVDLDQEVEESLSYILKSSVSKESLQKRISQLQKYTSEAQWRYQLIVNDLIPKQVGDVLKDTVVKTGDSSDEEVEIRGLSRQTSARKRKRSVQDKQTTKLEVKEKLDVKEKVDHPLSDSSAAEVFKRQKSRSNSVSRRHIGSSRSKGVITLMLSSPVTLLTMSIRKGNFTQTKQIIKLCKLEERPESMEVYFSQAFQKASRSIQTITTSTPPSPSAHTGGRLSMKSLANVAAAGVANVSVSNIADELLGFPTLPKLPTLDKDLSISQHIKQNFIPESVPVMILLDLMCTAGRSWEVCNHLMDSIKSRLPDAYKTTAEKASSADVIIGAGSKKPKGSKVQTFAEVLTCLESLLHLGADDQFPRQEPSVLCKQLQKSVSNYLNQATASLNAEKCKQYAVVCQNMARYIDKVKEAFKQQKKQELEKTESLQLSGTHHRRGSTDSVRSRVGSNTDHPVVHHRMKQLIHVLEKEIPDGGLVQLMRRQTHSGTSKNKNYLLSLYEHCREIAYLVSESESISRESAVVPKNYFVMLDEGPIRILGRMMFSKKMPPARLEKVAKKLSLNLTHIIVYSCCVKVPSKRLPVLGSAVQQNVNQMEYGKIIYNCAQGQSTEEARNPEEIVRSLLTRLITLMKDAASRCHAEGLFDYACADMMIDTTEYSDITSKISLIQSADLLQLTKQQRRCFFGNLQSLMTIHCFMNRLQAMKKQREMAADGHLVGNQLIHYSDMSVTEQITWLNTFAYRVGQLGVVSLFELKYIINRCGLLPPSECGKVLEHRLQSLDTSDPWYQLAPSPDPQMLFAMTACCLSSPPIQVLEPEKVRDQLDTALTNYLQTTVVVNKEKRLVKLPELLLWHRRDFISDEQYMSTDYKSENEDLIHFIVSQMEGDKEKDLKELLSLDRIHEFAENINLHGKNELPFDIEVVPYNKDFLCVFDFESINRGMKICSSRLNSSLTSQKSDQGEINDSRDMTYNMTPNTLDYIKADCPLVATLVSLVCSDDFDEVFIEDNLNEGHFGSSLSVSDPDSILNRSRSPSAMSLVDIRSYRYEKLTNEYPYLKRHLLNYFIPLAATEDHEILKGDDPILKLLTSSMMDRFKSSVLSLHESNEFRTLLSGLLNELFSMRKWTEVLNIIHTIPVTIIQGDPNFQNLYDFVLCCSVHKKCNSADRSLNIAKSKEVTTLIHGIQCTQTQAHEILTVYKKLQIDNNIELFEMCLNKRDLNYSLRETVEQKFQEVKVFYRITECAKNLQIKLSLQSSEFIREEDRDSMSRKHKILERFTDWSNVVEWTASSPREVLALLIKAGDFETAKSWCRLQKLTDDIRLEIEENHVISLLNSQPRNTTRAFQVLEELKKENSQVCLAICQKFVEVFNKQHDILFISSYILNQLLSELSDEQRDTLRLTHIGSRMMMFLPESMHIEYSHLVSTPRFLLEQLMMNMKSELAGRAFQAVKQEFQQLKNPALQFTEDQFSTLVAYYAKKALEFTVIQSLDAGEKERTFSKISISSNDRLDADSPRESPLPRPISDNALQKKKSIDFQASTRPMLSVSQPGGSSPGRRMMLSGNREKFVMPTEPPTRDQWVADSKASVCMVCKVERFSMFNRRHHCRRCGRVVCASCSGKTTLIRGVNARTCEDCYSQIVKQSDPERREPAEDMYQHQRLSGTSLTPQRFTPDNFGSTIQEERPLSLSEVVTHTQAAWKLKTDDDYNADLRQDFFFEQAPSTSLCISILNLHGNPRECGQLILRLCDDLSNLLKPIAPGVPNPEVDYSLIMSMMKYLLFHAKMKFIKTGENQGMAQCDMYQSLVDLLGLFVTANYRDLPSLQELIKVDYVRRLRDKLIEDERLLLAMEVSTKCGLDPTGVWVSMGMTCLQSGDFSGAREKFSKCLKPLKDKNVCSPPTKLLNDIIDCLETMPGTGSMEIQLLLSTPGAMKNLISTPASTFFEEASMDSQQFQECLFYLRTYGSFLAVIDFHRRHGYYMKAVQYILDHKCSMDIFVEGLLRPSLEAGELARLTDQMMMIDPSLERWNNYLTASCRYFVKNKLHHVLYEFQLFMKDYIRAGITCYTYFYQQGAQSYIDLARRIQYLFTAQQHMQAYLDPAQWGNVQHPLTVTQRQISWERSSKSDAVSVRLVKTPEEVKRYIKTIALQIEVTKYLQSCLTSGSGEAASVATAYVDSSKLPTLFTTPQARTDLAIMILLSGEDIEMSFGLANRIITEYKLGAVGIYSHAAREMAKQRHYDKMRKILDCVVKAGLGSDDTIDEIVGACLLVVSDNPSEAKEAENIIKLLRKDQNKINAYILCGMLKSAYLMAVKDSNVDDVKRILRAANSMGQTAIISICNKWLGQFQQKS